MKSQSDPHNMTDESRDDAYLQAIAEMLDECYTRYKFLPPLIMTFVCANGFVTAARMGGPDAGPLAQSEVPDPVFPTHMTVVDARGVAAHRTITGETGQATRSHPAY
jgi:hypothetical protein